MCGLNAIVWWGADTTVDDVTDAVQQMNTRLDHRGPDADGVWTGANVAIGHTRLRVIDLAGGVQPVVTEAAVLAFNGEIYNYRELRVELADLGHSFTDDSDTDVLRAALEQWGEQAVDHLNGDFAFIWYDRPAQRLLLGRDRLGVKPLYFKTGPYFAIISSELKGILAAEERLIPGSTPSLDRTGFLQTLLYGNPVPPTTFYDGVEALRGGEQATLCARSGLLSKTRYWELGDQDCADDRDRAQHTVAELLADSVALRMRSDVDYSVMLSGGLDSSLVAYLSGEVGTGTRAYTIGEDRREEYTAKSFMNGSDLSFARTVAAEAGHALKEFDELAGDVVEYVRRCARARDGLVTLASEVSMLKLFERIADSDTVVLSGDGADEVFLGYFMQIDTSGEVGPYYSSPRARFAFALLNPGFIGPLAAARTVRRRFDEDLAHLPARVRTDKRRLMHYLQLRFTLPYLLDRADRLSAAKSLELRVPYCDHRIAEYVFGLSDDLKYTTAEKKLLRDSFAGRFNDEVVYRKKSVFPFSEDESQLEELRAEVAAICARHRRDAGLVAQVYRLPLLTAMVANRTVFGQLVRVLGTFYLQAFLCQIISMDTLGSEYGLSTGPATSTHRK
ncbi:asparagine synthase (glutamine-hydrolyzing) [Nocardia mangyaensis]|uniref:asparagine synthase (glutamine-hydrolyzing) n=1 Tax=Nocardia mangyaensis TaxID=2213200 RepID=UPI002674DD51|nr:asparagine synthase (glutamine-hydrolyzing) [Nocardia mangyaensis]MDO3645919.1 asparagine synthase (glutamine-hydrolyzing) [Nocardia mangyaensis]